MRTGFAREIQKLVVPTFGTFSALNQTARIGLTQEVDGVGRAAVLCCSALAIKTTNCLLMARTRCRFAAICWFMPNVTAALSDMANPIVVSEIDFVSHYRLRKIESLRCVGDVETGACRRATCPWLRR